MTPIPINELQALVCICISTNTYIVELFLQVGKFPLTGKNSLYILIPRTASEESFVLMENHINKDSIEAMVSEMDKIPTQTAEVILPKIKLTVDTQLEDLLRKLGKKATSFTPQCCIIYSSCSKPVIHFLSRTQKENCFFNIYMQSHFPNNVNIIRKSCTTRYSKSYINFLRRKSEMSNFSLKIFWKKKNVWPVSH